MTEALIGPGASAGVSLTQVILRTAQETALAEARQRHQEYLQSIEPPSGLVSIAFGIDAANSKTRLDLVHRMGLHCLMFQTVARGAAGNFYVSLTQNIDINGAGHATRPNLPAISDNAWDWCGPVGGKSVIIRTPQEIEVISIFSTVPLDGILYAGGKPAYLPQ